MWVIADHLRSTSFLMADGVMPSNEGRGYVLRRIMRRAMRHAHLLGSQDPVMHRLVPALVRQMGAAYPELPRAQALIEETLRLEESRFKQTLDRGLKLLDDELSGLGEDAPLPGAAAFKLYDTYGFPLDLTQDALREKGRKVDTEGFDVAMAEQKAKARAAWSGTGESADLAIWFDLAETHGATDYLGYDTETAEGQMLALIKDGVVVDTLAEGDSGWIVLNQTPFYGESGGQVGDTGWLRRLENEDDQAEVTDTQRMGGGKVFAHHVTIKSGTFKKGEAVQLEVDHSRRTAIRANHSATHLLHEALRHALGDHVAQRGSLNAPDRLRFDFSHGKALTLDELRQVEAEVNAYILSEQDHRLAEVALELKAQGTDVPSRVRALLDERKALSNEVAQLRRELAMAGGAGQGGGADAREINGVKFVAQVLSGVSGKDLPPLIDEHKSRIGSGAVLLIADTGGKAAVAAGVTSDLTGTISAVDLVKAAVPELGGKGGGGRPDMAQGGGASAENAEAAIKAAEAVLGG